MQNAQVHLEEHQLTPYAPQPQRQDREKGAEWAPERGSCTCRGRKALGNLGTQLIYLLAKGGMHLWHKSCALGEQLRLLSCSWGENIQLVKYYELQLGGSAILSPLLLPTHVPPKNALLCFLLRTCNNVTQYLQLSVLSTQYLQLSHPCNCWITSTLYLNHVAAPGNTLVSVT